MSTKEKLQEESIQLRRLGNRAVRKAQAENRKLGIPNAFSRQEKVYFELPSGQITEENPFKEKGEGA
jgi:hypothetical protein